MLTSGEVKKVEFSTVRLRLGYDMQEVDLFLDTVIETLRGLEHGRVARPSMPLVTAQDVAAVRFSTTKVREGYDPEEVDQFVHQVAGTLAAYAASPSAPESAQPPPAVAPDGTMGSAASVGLTANELVVQLQNLHAVLFGAAQTAPVQARTPDGKIFTVSAVMPTPSGLVLALGR
jgi:DivIVA domain-containing protein